MCAKLKSGGSPDRPLSVEGVIMVRRTPVPGTAAVDDRETRIPVRPFAHDGLARVGVDRGATINMGNMQFGRVDVRVLFPCYIEEAADVLEAADALAVSFLDQAVSDLKNRSHDAEDDEDDEDDED